MEAFDGQAGSDGEREARGRNQRTQKCLSSPLVNDTGIVPQKLRVVNGDFELSIE
jgi:hypothetical protein